MAKNKRMCVAFAAAIWGAVWGVWAAQPPSWWTQTGAVTTEAAKDFAPVNVGQLKWMASCAREELDAKLVGVGGAGASIRALVDSFSQNDNYAMANIGQLKHVASIFYDRLNALAVDLPYLLNTLPPGMPGPYPWTETTTDDNDYAPANLGQLKYLFSFDLGEDGDSDTDGLPDWWERIYFGDLTSTATGDMDGDGLSNGDEYALGTNPVGVDTDGDGLSDGDEVLVHGTDPRDIDSDGDGYRDGYEIATNSDPLDAQNNPNGPVTLILPDDATIEGGLSTHPDALGSAVVFQNDGTPVSITWSDAVETAPAPLAHWPLNEAAGATVITDVRPGGQPGTSVSAVLGQSGMVGTAAYFNGTNSRIILGNPAALNFSGVITLSAWVKPEITTGPRNILAHGHRTSPNAEVFLRVADGKYQVGSWNGTNYQAQTPIPAEDLNTWVHLAGVYDGSHWRLYRNGVLVDSAASPIGALAMDADWAIGARGTGTERYFKGFVDDVALWCQALDADQIARLHARGQDGLSVGSLLHVLSRTWTATGESTVSGLQHITVQDTLPPEIEGPADLTLPAGSSSDPAETGDVTVSDLADPDPVVQRTDSDLLLREHLGGLYALDEGPFAEEVVDDSPEQRSSSGIHATLGEAGVIGRAAYFNGSNASIILGNPAALNFSGAITMSVWIKPETLGSLRNILAHGHRFNTYAEVSMSIHDGRYQVGSNSDGSGGVARFTAPAGDLNTWVHLVGVHNGTHWLLYRNGVQVASAATPVGAVVMDADWAIGSVGSGTERYFQGWADDVGIWNRALEAEEIALLYQRGLEGKSASSLTRLLSREWTVRDACGNTASWSQQLTYVLDTPPSLFTPADAQLGPADGTAPDQRGYAPAADASDPAPSVTWADRHDALSDDLLAHFDLNEPAQNATVASGSLAGTLEGGATLGEPGVEDGSARFNGVDGRIALASAPELDSLCGNLTVAAWIRPAGTTGVRRILSSGGTGGWGFGLNGSQLRFTTYGIKNYDLSAPLVAGRWQHVAAVMDAQHGVTFYVDGVLRGRVAGSVPANVGTSGWHLGSAGAVEVWNGRLDNVAVWSRPLADSEIAHLCALGRTGGAILPEATGDTLSIARRWSARNYAGLSTVGVQSLGVAPASVDADQDGLDARAEYLYGTDPSNADTDGDGLSDGDEVLVYGTDPLNADTDGDGLTDGQEVALGLDPKDALDALSDADGDGVSLLEEIIHGTDPLNADTDGDGISDGVELYETLTNALHGEFDGTVVDALILRGSAATRTVGYWRRTPTEIACADRRGAVEYVARIENANVYRLAINATHDWDLGGCNPVVPTDTSYLRIYIDDQYVGQYPLRAADGVQATVYAFLPNLKAGDHTIRVEWENLNKKISLRISDLRFQVLGGEDVDGDGVKDWVEAYISGLSGVDPYPAESVVSPLCIEGKARYLGLMDIAVNGQALPPRQGAGTRWYANLPLAESGSTTAEIDFQNGAVRHTLATSWKAFNLLVPPAELPGLADGVLTIRRGDAVKFTACPYGETSGSFSLSVDGLSVGTADAVSSIKHVFDTAGDHAVSATWNGGEGAQTGTLTVRVVAASFPSEPAACLIGESRTWNCPELPANVVLEADNTVAVSRNGNKLTLTATKTNRPHELVARLRPGGPIVASTPLNCFWVQAAVDNYMWTAERGEDYEIWENTVVAKNLPDSVDVLIKVFVAGVMLDDLTMERWIGASDLDELGQYDFRLIHPDSVLNSSCHTLLLYQDGQLIGEAYYSGRLMPDDE